MDYRYVVGEFPTEEKIKKALETMIGYLRPKEEYVMEMLKNCGFENGIT